MADDIKKQYGTKMWGAINQMMALCHDVRDNAIFYTDLGYHIEVEDGKFVIVIMDDARCDRLVEMDVASLFDEFISNECRWEDCAGYGETRMEYRQAVYRMIQSLKNVVAKLDQLEADADG